MMQNANANFLKSMGFNDENQAKTMFGMFSQFMSAMTGQGQQQQQNNQQQVQQQNDKTVNLEAQVEAMKLSAKPDKVDNIVILAIARNKANVGDAIKDIKKEQPDWFSDTQQGNQNGTGSTSGQNNQNQNQQNNQNQGKGTGSSNSGSSNSSSQNTNDYGKRLAETKKKTVPKTKYF